VEVGLYSDSLDRLPFEIQVETPQAILLAAEKLFAQHGYHAVTIRDIADEAGVPLALVGYYFGPKHELFAAIFEHWSGTLDERIAGLRQIAADAPADDALLTRTRNSVAALTRKYPVYRA